MNASDNNTQLARAAFLRAFARFKGLFGEAAVASVLINVMALLTSLFSMQVFDRVLPNHATSTLWVLFAGLAVAIGFEALLRTVRARVTDAAGKRMELELSQIFFEKAMDIRMDARPRTVGTFASQVKDFDVVKSFLTSTTLFVLADAPFALLFLGVIALLGGWVVVVPMLMLPLVLLVAWWVQKPLGELTELHSRESSIKTGMLIEAIDGAESIKAAGGRDGFAKRWAELSALVGEVGLRTRHYSNLASTLGNALQQLAYAGTVVAGVYQVAGGNMTQGAIVACSILVGRVLSPMSQLTGLAVSWHHAKAALRGLDDLMSRPNDGESSLIAVRLDNVKPALRLESVKHTYDQNGVTAMDVPAVEIAPGEKVGIIGPSGSGKSTLLKLLSGLYKPAQGRVFLSGVDLHLMEPAQVRDTIAYLPQDVRLFNGSLRDNLVMGMEHMSDSDVMEMCEVTGLTGLVQSHPRGVALEISEGGRGLSGGQRQLVGLTRTLSTQAPVLLMDEPTASLDPQNELRLINRLKTFFKAEQTVVMVTHKPALLALVDRIIVVDRGCVIADGPKEKILQTMREGKVA